MTHCLPVTTGYLTNVKSFYYLSFHFLSLCCFVIASCVLSRKSVCLSSCIFFFFFFAFWGPHLWHTEVSRLGVKSELQLSAYTTATAMWDPSLVCDLHPSSQQCQIPKPLSEARDYPTSWLLVRFVSPRITMGAPSLASLLLFLCCFLSGKALLPALHYENPIYFVLDYNGISSLMLLLPMLKRISPYWTLRAHNHFMALITSCILL